MTELQFTTNKNEIYKCKNKTKNYITWLSHTTGGYNILRLKKLKLLVLIFRS